jgi:hypothetical protein
MVWFSELHSKIYCNSSDLMPAGCVKRIVASSELFKRILGIAFFCPLERAFPVSSDFVLHDAGCILDS